MNRLVTSAGGAGMRDKRRMNRFSMSDLRVVVNGEDAVVPGNRDGCEEIGCIEVG